MQIIMTPDILLAAYSQGLFPMAYGAHTNHVHWFCPEKRGQLSIQNIHIPRRLKKTVRSMKLSGQSYEIYINRNFKAVMEECAKSKKGREETWINQKIIDAFCELHKIGRAHSVETWQNDTLIGGLYGVSIGGAFFGESMFSIARDASKVALVHLVARLHHAGFKLLDTQFTNNHLEQFGVYELSYHNYLEQLAPLLDMDCVFDFNTPDEKTLINSYLMLR